MRAHWNYTEVSANTTGTEEAETWPYTYLITVLYSTWNISQDAHVYG